MHKFCLPHGPLAVRYGDEKALEYIQKAGFQGVEISLENALKTGLLTGDENVLACYCLHIKETAKKYGLSIFNAYLPRVCEDETARKNAVKATAWMGANLLTLCPIVLDKSENNYQKNLRMNLEYYGVLKPEMEEFGVRIAIENRSLKSKDVWRFFAGRPSAVSSAEKLLDLRDRLGDGFCISLDVGHAYLAEEDPAETARLLGDALVCVRLWDTDVSEERHIAPTFGYVKWDALLTELRELHFDGVLTLDVDLLRVGEGVELAFVAYLGALSAVFAGKLNQ